MSTADDAMREATARYTPLEEQPGAFMNAIRDVFVAGAQWHEDQQALPTRDALAHTIAAARAGDLNPQRRDAQPAPADYRAADAVIAHLTNRATPGPAET